MISGLRMPNNFFLVPQIVEDSKYFDVSIPEILRAVRKNANGKFDRTEEHITEDEYGVPYTAVIRLNVNCQSEIPEGWTIAVKLHNERIDGIDWEPDYIAIDGTRSYGWHRHQWSQKKQSAKHEKLPIAEMNSVDNREQFLIRAFSVMKITVSATDYGDQLSIAESTGS